MHRIGKIGWLSNFGRLAIATLALSAGVVEPAMAAPDTPATGALDDARIVSRVLSFDQAEEQVADSVKGKLSSPGPWNLAQRLSLDYADLDQRLRGLAGAAPRPPDAGAAEGQLDRADLSKVSGDTLDRAYVNREVKSHEAMLMELDRQLIPNAGEGLQRQLVDLRSEVAAHLRYAQAIQHAQWLSDAAAQERADISREISNSGP